MNTHYQLNAFQEKEAGFVYVAGTHSVNKNRVIISSYTLSDNHEMERQHTKVFEQVDADIRVMHIQHDA